MSSLGDAAGPGLTVTRFLAMIPEPDVRRLLNPDVLRILDALFGGRIGGDDLRRAAKVVVDFRTMLSDPAGRKEVLSLLQEPKRTELYSRVGAGRSTDPESAVMWSASNVQELLDFFGLVDEPLVASAAPPMDSVSPAYGLFDHQRTAVRDLLPLLAEDERRAVLHLPTGVGKTRTAMHVVAHWLRSNDPSVVVWLASGRELLDQAYEAFQEAWEHLGTRPVQIGAMWGNQTPDLDRFSDGFLVAGLAKGWALMSGRDPGWAARLSPRVRLVVFDEAHQSIASTYRQITDELTLDYRCALLGLTATPGRTWADIDKDGELADYFSRSKVMLNVEGDNPVEYLIEHGYLARPKFLTLLAEPGFYLDGFDPSRTAEALDIPPRIVAALSMSEQYVAAVVAAIKAQLAKGHLNILVFAATVDHAQLLAAILVAQDLWAEVVTASTPSRTRHRIIRSFGAADRTVPMILLNFGVLTTGFDAPMIDSVVIARPTQSLVLYSQMVGRALRGPRAGGTETCEIVTVVDLNLPGFGNVADAFLNWEDVWTSN